MSKKVKILRKDTAYDGFFQLNKYSFSFDKFQGEHSSPITREVFERGHAVGALLYDPQHDEVVLIEQVRLPAHIVGQNAWMYEIVAGMIDEGETPEEAIKRETSEESGCTIKRLKFLLDYMPSPGACTETVKLYIAEVDTSNLSEIMGLDEEDEDIRVFKMQAAEFIELSQSNVLKNGLIIIAALWFAQNHKLIQEEWSKG